MNSINMISFNCKSVMRSEECIRRLCREADIIALQETWLLPHDIPTLGNIDPDFGFTGKSAVDTSVGVLRGRPYGGVAILWKKSIFTDVSVIQCNSVRVTAIKINLGGRNVLVFSVYMPTDSPENLMEFTECMGEIAAVVEDNGEGSVYVLGDFNANPSSCFGNELINFCTELDWRCADIEFLGYNSKAYTYVSEAHGTHSWLDHCLVSETAWKSVTAVSIMHDVFWSDHFPLKIRCNLDVFKNGNDLCVYKLNKIVWGIRDFKQIELYKEFCNNRLKTIDFPYDFRFCSDKICNNLDHRRVIDQMYNDITQVLKDAACHSYKNKTLYNKRRYLTGWNKHVRKAYEEARLGFKAWVWHGRPKEGLA